MRVEVIETSRDEFATGSGMTIFLGHSHLVPKYELSSRPERSREPALSEVEGADRQTSAQH